MKSNNKKSIDLLKMSKKKNVKRKSQKEFIKDVRQRMRKQLNFEELSNLLKATSSREFDESESFDYWNQIRENTKTPMPFVLRKPTFEKKKEKETKIAFGQKPLTDETIEVCMLLNNAIQSRMKNFDFKFPWDKTEKEIAEEAKMPPDYGGELVTDAPKTSNETFVIKNGLISVYDKTGKYVIHKPSILYKEYYRDYKQLQSIMKHAAAKTFCFSRLKFLELKFLIYKEMYAGLEVKDQKEVPHRDFYNVRKVDNHIHLSSSMNQKRLLKFIKSKIKEHPNDVVMIDKKTKEKKTLQNVFDDLKLNPYDLSVDSLDVHATKDEYHRFDKFNYKFNPFGTSELRSIFLKTENDIEGRYFAELCREVFDGYEKSKYQLAEVRVSIYGRKRVELKKLAHWVIDNNLCSPNIRFIIQIPRLFHIHREKKVCATFEEWLGNVFIPFFEYTKDPQKDPVVTTFLEKYLVAFDTVDDESKWEPTIHSQIERPDVWGKERHDNPPYAYYNYYLHANVKVLNKYRKARGMSTYGYRPHTGEAGDISHLTSSFLLADSINHGIKLKDTPVLSYLYYLMQIGMSMSPLSNNCLFLSYDKNPFPKFFAQGFNVTLSTDDPLMFHFTEETLIEEYSIAQQIYELNTSDICEIAKNSVLQSGWSDENKGYWISRYYNERGVHSNNNKKTNVPTIRTQYRYETLLEEHLFIQNCLGIAIKHSPKNPKPLLKSKEMHSILKDLREHKLNLFAHPLQMEYQKENFKVVQKKKPKYSNKEVEKTRNQLDSVRKEIHSIRDDIKRLKHKKKALKERKKGLKSLLKKQTLSSGK